MADHYLAAKQLAGRQYSEHFLYNETTMDGEPVIVALSPELPGCIGQGKTDKDASKDLYLARISYIASLLNRNVPVPEPMFMTGRCIQWETG